MGYDLLSKDFGQAAWPVVTVALQGGEAVLQGAYESGVDIDDSHIISIEIRKSSTRPFM